MKIFKIILAFVLATFLLSSCMMGPKFQKPQVPIADSYLGEHVAGDSINLRWWELFGDNVLDTMIDHALKYNKDVQMAAKRIEQARAYHGMTKADLWPSISIQAGAARGNYAGGMKASTVNNQFFVTPALSWELDFWGKYRSLSAAAQSELIATEYGMRSMQISLISDVSTMYFQLLDYQNRLDISKKTVETRLNSLKIIRMRFDEGIVPEIDLNQAEAQWAVAVAAVPSYERALAQTSYALSVILGENPRIFITDASLESQLLVPEIPTGIPSKLIERRPDIGQAEAQLRAQNANIGAAIAARFPSISLTGILGAASNDLASLTTGGLAWSAGASLLGPVFEFGKNKRRVEVERKKAEELLLNYENVVLYAFKDVEDALISIQTSKRELEANKIYFKAVDNAAKLSAMRYDKGVTSYLEVLENERSAFNAELKMSLTRVYLLNSYVSLYKALGGGWINPDEEAQAQQVK
jgi:multidrug efflux system outer membrane protein